MTKAEERKQARERFATASRLEREYLRSLRYVTNQIDHMIKGVMNGAKPDIAALEQMLVRYSQLIEPWARSVAQKMLTRVARKDENAWIQTGNAMGKALRKDLQNAPIEAELQKLLAEQVHLITSLPLEAAQRVHKMSMEGLVSGERANSISQKILETGSVTESRAKLIARTEIARTASGLTQVRAQYVGSTHYYWRTSGDGDVRPSHKVMNNKVIEWANPPEVDPGKYYHAGQFPNCRCFPSPIIDI